jgi:anti-sigma regulatory factor (Ser/Thr protein kinase)
MTAGDRISTAQLRNAARRPNAMPRAAGSAALAGDQPTPILDESFDATTLVRLRSMIATQLACQVTSQAAALNVDDVVLVAHELAGNAVRHGGGSGRLRMWCAEDRIICTVSDNGPGIADAEDKGYEPPAPRVAGGRGLWIARRLAELHIASTPSGTTVTATMPSH